MKGLLLKDIYNMNSIIKVYMILPLLMSFLCYMYRSMGMLAILPAFFGIFITLSTYAYDEMCGFDSYAMSLPLNRKDFVLSKYAITLLFVIIGVVLAAVLANVLYLFGGSARFADFDQGAFLSTMLSITAAIILVNAILLPFIVKYGTQKARILLVIFFLIIGFFGNVVIIKMNHLFQIDLLQYIHGAQDLWGGILVILAIAVFAISAMISIRIMGKKEF